MHFFCDGERLKESFQVMPALVRKALADVGRSFDDFAQVFVHQVSARYSHEIIAAIGAPPERVFWTLHEHGNLVAASLPVGIALAEESGRIGPGDRVLALGLASGISVGLMIYEVC